jgi:hypothetical protein
MPIDTRAKAKQIAGRAQQRADKLGANQDRGLMQELNYRQASKQSDRFTRAGEQMEAGTYKAPKKNRDVNQFDKGQNSSNMSIDDYDFGKKYNMRDVKYLKEQGFNDDQIAKDMAARDQSIGGRQGRYLKQTGNLGMVAKQGQDEGLRAIAKGRAQARVNNRNSNNNNSNQNNDNSNQNNDNSINNSGNTTIKDSGNQSGNSGAGSGNNVDGDGNQLGNNNSQANNNTASTTSTGGSLAVDGDGNTFGDVDLSNKSVNIVSQDNGGDKNYDGGMGDLDLMMKSAAYTALNNNQLDRSGASGSAAAARNRAANAEDNSWENLLNTMGEEMNYWKNRGTVEDARLYGDTYDGVRTFKPWSGFTTPSKPEDKTQEIADEFDA